MPAHEIAFAEQAAIFNRAFTGYLAGWHDLDAAGIARVICAQNVDLFYSRFIRADGALAGFGYINRTGNITRLGAMGTVPEARRSGAAAHLLLHLLGEAKARDDQAMVLEVFEQNTPALTLYRRHDFKELMRLFGWKRAAGIASAEARTKLEEISLLNASRLKVIRRFPEIPWQVSQHAVLKAPGARAYKIDNACVVISDPQTNPVRIHSVLWSEDALAAQRVLSAVLARFADKDFFAPAIFPEEFGVEIYGPLGFTREPLNQILMRRDL